MVTHEPEIARHTQRIVTLRDGRIRSDRRMEPLDAAQALASLANEEGLELDDPVADPHLQPEGAPG
jgi:ABC-type lipoprotein export system ATPase subunit